MSEEIKPAMTPEEWNARQIRDSTGALDLGAQDFHGLTANGHFGDDRRKALAALALHGQPFGFTWDDVELLRDAANVADAQHGATDESHFYHLRAETDNLADRIAALLPPRDR